MYGMDEPIIYTRDKVSHIDPDKLRLDLKLFHALVNDEKDEFMRLINQPGFKQQEHLPDYLRDMFRYDALEIATAVLNGETKGLVDMVDVLKDGTPLLHLAVKYHAPRLTKYFLDNGYKADALCAANKWNIKEGTPLDLSLHRIHIGDNQNLHNLLWWVCFHNREAMEIIRMLVRSAEDKTKTWARTAFLRIARKGELHQLAALFLAVPDLFLSPPQSELSLLRKLNIDELSSWEDDTFIKKHLPSVIDVFTLVGEDLATYIRLKEYDLKEGFTHENYAKSHLEIDYFLHKVADKKKPVEGPSRDYYYLSFFEVPVEPNVYGWIDDDADWDTCTSRLKARHVFLLVPYLLTREEFKRDAIYSLIPRLDKHAAVLLSSAIEKKLSSLKGETIQVTFEQKAAAAATKSAKLPSKPLPPAQAVREARNEGGRGGRGANGAISNKENLVPNENGFIPLDGAMKKPYEGRIGFDGGRGGRRGGFTNGDADGERHRRIYERRSGTGRGSEIKRGGASRGNWGTTNDDIARDVEEPIAENEVNVAAEKPAGEEENVDAEKETTVNKAEEEPEEKQYTLEEYEMILEEKRKALPSLSEQKKGEERMIDVKEFQSMHLISKKKNDDEVFIKLDSEKDKRRESAEREEKSKKSMSINEFLKPAECETHYRWTRKGKGRGVRGRRYGGGGGYARNNG